METYHPRYALRRRQQLISDEGNIANNTKSDAMILAEALSIERRWIVSGSDFSY